MSEENQVNNPTEEKKCKFNLLIGLVILSLVLSVTSLTLSILGLRGDVSIGGQGNKKVVISKQYDKGKSMEKAKATGKPIIVFFYTDWCHFCQSFAPTFNKISKDSKIKKNFAVAYVNCEKEENRSLMQEYNVQGFPTVYVIITDGSKVQLENGTFFNPDSKTVVRDRALEIIGQ